MIDEILNRIFGKLKKTQTPFNAEYAWFESTYGDTYMDIETRIKNKQNNVKEQIRDCFKTNNINVNRTESYKCFVDVPSDLCGYTDEIFKPFIENGFKVVSLHDKIDELKDDCTYLISWRHIYNKT